MNCCDSKMTVTTRKLRIAFLVGNDTENIRDSIEAVCQLRDVDPVAMLVDTERVPLKRRVKNLRRNLRTQGWGYIARRLLAVARGITERWAYRAAVSPEDVRYLLRKAFPLRCFDLLELGQRYAFKVHAAGNLNGTEAVGILSDAKADLGIVLGT